MPKDRGHSHGWIGQDKVPLAGWAEIDTANARGVPVALFGYYRAVAFPTLVAATG